MSRANLLPMLALGCLSLVSAGCGKPAATPNTSAPAAPAVTMGEESADPEEAKITAELAKLPEADRTAAVAQRICPVSDQRLGSMPGVTKLTVEGRDVFVCCDHCKSDLEAEPAKFFAKLDAAK